MGMVFQHFNVFNNLTVGKNVTLAPVLLGKKTQKEADEMMRELLNRVGLADKENQFPKKPVSYTHLDVYKRQNFSFISIHFTIFPQ